MVEEILSIAQASTYDFRKTAYPEDPLRHLFPEWISYYRTKWAIAKVLKPTSILEIGVRYGYSALAFLSASPSARYLGIDLDVPSFGGSVGAIDWARRVCGEYEAEFIVADSTKMDQFPGGRYDLIHVDGQQDELGTTHDLIRASSQACYILVDGFFWSRSNFFSASEFLYRFRDLIEFYEVVPGYAGELLVKIKAGASNSSRTDRPRAEQNDSITRSFYLADEIDNRTVGLERENLCREAVARLAGAAPRKLALALDCARGELSLELARQGFEVESVDYSEDALAIAREVKAIPFRGQYGVAVATDLIEHMKPAELDRLCQRTAEYLAEDGLFIVHTYPNLWYYKYEHRRKLKLASQIGAYLPNEPRSRYELLVHINEQSPQSLRRQLKKYFSHVLVWFGNPSQAGKNLGRRLSISEMRAAPDLFAVASRSPLSISKLSAQFRMEPLAEREMKGIKLAVNGFPSRVRPSARFTVSVELHNATNHDLKSTDPHPVHLSYHWMQTSGQYVLFEGERTRLAPDARRKSVTSYDLQVTAPAKPGTYLLRVTLVQEGIRWFDQVPGGARSEMKISCLA